MSSDLVVGFKATYQTVRFLVTPFNAVRSKMLRSNAMRGSPTRHFMFDRSPSRIYSAMAEKSVLSRTLFTVTLIYRHADIPRYLVAVTECVTLAVKILLFPPTPVELLNVQLIHRLSKKYH